MIYSSEVEEMCFVRKGVDHGPSPIPEEGKWIQSKQVTDISGLTHGVGGCAPHQGACKLTLNIKEGIIQEALVETIGCSGMYSYFASKEDLFLTIVNNANELMDRILGEVVENSKDIFDVVERMVAAARKVGQEYPKLNQIYLDITTQALSAMSARLSSELERITPGLLSQFLAEGKFNGILRQDLDERVASYCIDNILMMYQFSFSSDYYKDRMKIFVGPEKMDDIKHLEQEIVRFIRASITAS